MKRYGNLYPKIVEFENLLSAARQAQQGKRYRENVLEFNYNLERELVTLERELRSKTYQPGNYRTFYIKEPKLRMISAAPYRDRVVHHALCNVIVPIFERTFIHDSSANRVGFGTHKALRRFTQFARSSESGSLVGIAPNSFSAHQKLKKFESLMPILGRRIVSDGGQKILIVSQSVNSKFKSPQSNVTFPSPNATRTHHPSTHTQIPPLQLQPA